MLHIFPEGDEEKHTFNEEGECECNPVILQGGEQPVCEHRKYTILEEAAIILDQAERNLNDENRG